MLDMVDPVDRVDSVGYVDDLDNVDKSPGPIECSAFVAGVAEEVAHDEAVAAALHGFVRRRLYRPRRPMGTMGAWLACLALSSAS
jgi:hypothetical protein